MRHCITPILIQKFGPDINPNDGMVHQGGGYLYKSKPSIAERNPERAGVAQLGKSVRLIIERSRAQVPPPAFHNNSIWSLFPQCSIYFCSISISG
jgi:hypothetical protein